MNVWKYTSAAAASSPAEMRQEACIIGLPLWPNTAAEHKQMKGGSWNEAENNAQKVAAQTNGNGTMSRCWRSSVIFT